MQPQRQYAAPDRARLLYLRNHAVNQRGGTGLPAGVFAADTYASGELPERATCKDYLQV